MRPTCLVLFMCVVAISPVVQALDLYVAMDGNDAWSGRAPVVTADSVDGPFATLERARDEILQIRARQGLPAEGVTVHLREGVYHRDKVFELSLADTGTQACPIVYRAYKDEEVIISGGLPITDFTPVSDKAILDRLDPSGHGKVLQSNLKSQGFTDFGRLLPRGFGRGGKPAGFELFYQDKPMTMARWPNEGYVRIAEVPDGPQGGKFVYQGDRPERWKHADDVWLHGFWTHNWADSYESVREIDTESKVIATNPPHGTYGYKANARYYALNLLEEIDRPGEWYLDRATGILYFWPPASIDNAKVYGSIALDLIMADGVSYLTVQGMTLEACRGTAVRIKGGSHSRIAGCVIRNIGSTAVRIQDGTDNGVVGCDVYGVGDGVLTIVGGDRKTLTPARNYAVNNHIHDYSRWVSTYTSAIRLLGVGNRAAHNLIHDAPHNAIGIHGNDHLIEFNEVHHVCMDTDDAGAFYMGRDWGERGNVIRYNYWHDIGQYKDRYGVRAIYQDDCSSGTTIHGNIFEANVHAVFIGGGRDHVVTNNIFVDNAMAVWLDARGLTWQRLAEGKGSWDLMGKIKAFDYDKPPYSVRYPRLAAIQAETHLAPKGHIIARNVFVGKKWIGWHMSDEHREIADVTIEDNLTDQDPLFADRKTFQLKENSPAYELGFKPIPFGKIGLYEDEFRKLSRN